MIQAIDKPCAAFCALLAAVVAAAAAALGPLRAAVSAPHLDPEAWQSITTEPQPRRRRIAAAICLPWGLWGWRLRP